MTILLPVGVALFVLPLLLIAVYAARVEKRQRKRLFELETNFKNKAA